MNKETPKYDYEYFENFYNEAFQKGETFCPEIGEKIQSELDKMAEEFKKWLKEQQQNNTVTKSESLDKT